MRISVILLVCLSCVCLAETRVLTLRQALDLALQQNADVVLARLEQQKARADAAIAGAPFSPQLIAGSGAAWTYGFPTSIEGNAPAVAEAKTIMSIFDKPQSYLVAQAKENLRGAGIDISAKQQETAYQVAGLFLDAQRASRSLMAEQRRVDELTRVHQLVQERFSEGRQLQIDVDKANNDILHAKRNVRLLDDAVTAAESSLAVTLGMNPTDRVRPVEEEETSFAASLSEDEAVQRALDSSPEMKKLASDLQAKMLEISSYKARRLPKVDLVAQYSLLSKINNFQDYFQRFQRNNVELGASIQVPIITGSGPKAYMSKAETEAAEIRAQVQRTRGRIESDIRRAYRDSRSAEDGLDLAKSDLDLARKQVDLDLNQAAEGRVPQSKIEQDRAAEDGMWVAFYDAQITAERARLNVLHATGTILEAVK